MNNAFYNIEKKNDLEIFFLILIIAFVYSCIVNPHSQEAVTFAYIANDKINNYYFDNWIYITKNQEPTLQILLPYFLIQFGFNKILLHFVWQSLTAIISFSAVFYFSKLFTKSNHLSLLVILILIFHKFINTNLYGLYYPTHFFYFGQAGMYLTLLSITFFFKNKYGLGTKIFIITVLMHAGWGLFNLLLLFIFFILKKNKIKDILNLSNSIFFITALIITIVAINNVKQYDFYKSYSIEKIEKNEIHNSKLQPKYTEGHHIKFNNYKNLNEKIFFISKFIFFDFLILIFWIIFRKKNFNKEEDILKIFLVSTILVYFYLFFQKDILTLINFISPFISEKLNRIIVNRFLNINNLVFIVTGLSIFMKFVSNKKFQKDLILISLFFLLIIFSIIFQKKQIGNIIPYGEYINFVNLVVWSCCIYGMIKVTFKNKIFIITPKFIENLYFKIKAAHIYFIFLVIFISLSFKNISTYYEKRVAMLSIDKNSPIIFGGQVYGKFDTLYYGDSPWIMPLSSDKRFYIPDKKIDLYCLGINSIFLRQQDWHSFINNKCFQDKTKSDWHKIYKTFGFKYLIVPKKNDIDLKKIYKFKKFDVYLIN